MSILSGIRSRTRRLHDGKRGLAVDVAAIAGSQIALGMIAGRPSDPKYYRQLKQAPFAPPSWVFGPAWFIAKVGSAVALVDVCRTKQMPHRSAYFALAGIDAAIYISFSYVYFRRRSTTLAAVWTTADAGVTAAQLAILASGRRKAALGLTPQAAWLGLATPVAIYQAVNN